MKVFLTGATGFIGSYLAEELINRGYKVRCLIRTTSRLRWIADLDVEVHYGSLADKESLLRGLEGVDYVFHLAGVTKALTQEEYYRGNFEGTKNLIDAVLKSQTGLQRLVMVSSQAVAGPSPTIKPIDEQAEPRPLTWYGKSKLAAERYVLAHKDKIPVTVVRPPVVYGPRDTDVLDYFKTVKKGLIPSLNGKEKYLSLIYVQDLVRGIVAAAESASAAGNIYFLADVRPYSWEDIARAALSEFHKKGLRIYVPSFLVEKAAWVADWLGQFTRKPGIFSRQKFLEMKPDFWICSPKKALEDFNFKVQTSLEEGVRATISWYREYGWL